MKKLLVPFDFSAQSVSAFRFALDIATQSQGTIHLLHIIELPVLHDPLIMPLQTFEKEFLDELQNTTKKRFAKVIAKYAPDGDVKSHLAFGSINNGIISFIQKEKIDLVIMGTKGVGGLRELLIGSNTEKVVRKSPVPVLSVKEYKEGMSIKNIVFPHAPGSEENEDLIMKIKALQNFFHATLHVIWVNTPAIHKPEPEIRKQLVAFANRFMLKDYTVNVFSNTDEESGIIEFTDEIKADLIAMGTHGRTGVAHVMAGSVAEDVVNHVQHPVWTYSMKAN